MLEVRAPRGQAVIPVEDRVFILSARRLYHAYASRLDFRSHRIVCRSQNQPAVWPSPWQLVGVSDRHVVGWSCHSFLFAYDYRTGSLRWDRTGFPDSVGDRLTPGEILDNYWPGKRYRFQQLARTKPAVAQKSRCRAALERVGLPEVCPPLADDGEPYTEYLYVHDRHGEMGASVDSSWLTCYTDIRIVGRREKFENMSLVKVWRGAEDNLLMELDQGGPVRAVRFSPDGLMLYVLLFDGTLKVWDVG